jgi:hypothetical protein
LQEILAMKITRLGWPILLFTLAAASSAAMAQSQSQQSAQQSSDDTSKQDPLVEAARKTREQKKAQPKAAHVWNDENIPKQGEGVSVVGSTETAPAPGEAAPAPHPVSAQDKAQLNSAVRQAKEKVAALEQDVDIAQRKFSLDSDMYYGKTNYQDDKAGKAALDAEQADVANKKLQLKEAQEILASLQTKLSSSTNEKKPQ